MDKKTIAIIVLSAIIVILAGIFVYKEIRLGQAPDTISKLQQDNVRLAEANDRLIVNVERLNDVKRANDETIAGLRTTIGEHETNNIKLRIRIDRLESNFEQSIPIYNEIDEIFKFYAAED